MAPWSASGTLGEPRGAAGRLKSINFSPQGAPRRRLPRPSDAPLELVLRTPAGSVAGLGANAPTGSGHGALVAPEGPLAKRGEDAIKTPNVYRR